MPYKLFSRNINNNGRLEKGQEWSGETVQQNLASISYEGYREIFESHMPRHGMTLDEADARILGLAREPRP